MSDVVKWLNNLNHKHMVLRYGSLLSKDSRERFSNIYTQSIPVNVKGFERGWITRSEQEQQTYVGAIRNRDKQLNAHLIPTDINPGLQEREKDYRFIQVALHDIHLNRSTSFAREEQVAIENALAPFTFWMCETLAVQPASHRYPVHQTYIDTCISGCLEQGGEAEAQAFIAQTSFWRHNRVNDRRSPKYPRAAVVDIANQQKIDELLAGTESM